MKFSKGGDGKSCQKPHLVIPLNFCLDIGNKDLASYGACHHQTSLKWLTVAMPLLETSERLERDKRELKLWLMA